MKKIILVLIVLFITAGFIGCYYDKADLVYPSSTTTNPVTPTPGTCDTLVVRYNVEIKNILSANCYACHSGAATNGGGHKYDVYPGDLVTMAKNGKLVLAITHSPGAVAMPKGGGMLSDCDIAKIRWWVKNGAPNN